MSRSPVRRLPDEPSNAEIMAKLNEITDRLALGDQRFSRIDARFDALQRVADAADTIVQVADTYRLVGLGGKTMVWIGKGLAAIGTIVVSFFAFRAWWTGEGPPP